MNAMPEMGRRGLLKLLAALPFAGASMTPAAAAKLAGTGSVVRAMGVNDAAGVAPVTGHYLFHNRVIVAMMQSGTLPEWVRDELRQHAIYESRAGLLPDVACLVSVSASSKIRMTREAYERRMLSQAMGTLLKNEARSAFFGENVGSRL